MIRTIADWIVKCLVLLIAAAWVFIYWQKRDDGRYVYREQPQSADYTDDFVIFDTRTGTLLMGGQGQWPRSSPANRIGGISQDRAEAQGELNRYAPA